ncbi:MAG: DUF192 domain-containing protein [Deltaproteobacteria bacterium]|nr:DUF192 domain-containing protein [Deltaproteobacteria bacterium]
MIVVNRTKGKVLGDRVGRAETFFRRLRGLLFAPPLEGGEGLWIAPCGSVHTFGMRYPIDVLFLDRRGEVVGLYPNLAPNRFTKHTGRAKGALELPAGMISGTGTELSDRLELLGGMDD